jgi:hypothetical protein
MQVTREAGAELIVESQKRAAAVIVRRTHPAAACRDTGWTFAVRVGRPGLDIVNDYYDPLLKEARPKRLAAGCTARPRSSRSRR